MLLIPYTNGKLGGVWKRPQLSIRCILGGAKYSLYKWKLWSSVTWSMQLPTQGAGVGRPTTRFNLFRVTSNIFRVHWDVSHILQLQFVFLSLCMFHETNALAGTLKSQQLFTVEAQVMVAWLITVLTSVTEHCLEWIGWSCPTMVTHSVWGLCIPNHVSRTLRLQWIHQTRMPAIKGTSGQLFQQRRQISCKNVVPNAGFSTQPCHCWYRPRNSASSISILLVHTSITAISASCLHSPESLSNKPAEYH